VGEVEISRVTVTLLVVVLALWALSLIRRR